MWIRIGNWARSKMVLILCLGILLNLCPLYSYAEDIRFEATVNANKISLHDVIQLTLVIHGVKGDISTIPMPVVDEFETRFVGPATSYTFVNGVSSSEHSFIYNLFPSKTGHFEIPSVILTLDGKTYTTSPIKIEVVDAIKKSTTDPNGGTGEDTPTNIEERVFMKASIEPTEVYVGQKTPLTMKVYVTELSLQLAAAPYLTPNGFTADKTASMQKNRETINGLSYETMTFNANIYPTQPGDLNIGPFQAAGQLLYRSKQGDDLLGGFFSNVESRPITLHAPVISLHVLPLPTEDQSKDFSGAVGQYTFKASVSPLSVKVGDPLTLRMSIAGNGQINDLIMPVFNDSRFKSYDPQIKDAEDSKTLEQVLIPTDQKITEVPAISFSYFDPKDKEYKTITQGPFPIQVLPLAAGQEFKAYGFIDKTKVTGEKNFSVQLDGITNLAEHLVAGVKRAMKDWRFWASIFGVFLVWFAWRLWQDFQKKLQNDQAFARKWQAGAKAKELLSKTKSYLQQRNTKEFYSSLYKTLNDYLADKMHVPLASLSWGMIETYLKERSIESSKLETLKTLFERCDLVRFASASIPEDHMQKDFEQLGDLINYLPKILK